MSPVFTDNAAWDMRRGYFEMTLQALGAAFDARMEKDAPQWLDLLDGLYSRVRPFFKVEEREVVELQLTEIKNDLYSHQEDERDDLQDQAMSRTIDALNALEKDIIIILNKHGLLVPKKIDPAHAALDGVG